MKQSLEEKLKTITKDGLNKAVELYDSAYLSYPKLTRYISTAIGTIGGDVLSKQFTENPNVKPRDIVFTASAAIAYSYLAPKMIEWSTKATDKISNHWNRLKENKMSHTLFNTCLLTAMYFPVNIAYWNYLTIKNQAPITIEDNIVGAITLGIASIPYLAADYLAIKKFSQPNTTKYVNAFYSGVEILWNTLFAGGNYLAKRM